MVMLMIIIGQKLCNLRMFYLFLFTNHIKDGGCMCYAVYFGVPVPLG